MLKSGISISHGRMEVGF